LKIKELLKNKQVLSLAGNMVMALLNLITSAVLYRHLSTNNMGIYGFFLIIFTLIDTFRTGFLQTSFVKFYAGTTEERGANILGSTWAIGLTITGIVTVLNIIGLFFLTYISDVAYITIIKWTSIQFMSTLPIVMATWLLQAQQRYMEILYIRVVNQTSFILAVIGLIYFNNLTLDNVLLVNALSCVITCIVAFCCRWTGIRALPKQSKSAITELFHFGKFSMGTSISANLLRSSDTIIIKLTLGKLADSAIAVYTAAQTLTNLLDIPLRSFVTTGMTSISAAQNMNEKDKVEEIFKKYAGALTIIFIPVVIGLVIFADVAVKLLGGGKYVGTPAANIFRIFMIFAVFLPIDRFIGVTMDVIHKPKINFYKVLIMLAINVGGDLLGVYIMHSIYGIALASIPTFVLGTLFGYFSLKLYLKFSFMDIIKFGWGEAIVLVKGALGKLAPRS
jgi:O-antigen/teichoic acid export membrane protein